MHELGIAQSVLDIVRQYVPERRAGDVRRVTVRLGALSGVVADSLEFCFSALVADSAYGAARLAVEWVRAEARCETCGEVFSVEALVFRCPACQGPRVRLVSGDELLVVAVDLADGDEGVEAS